jgi:hypothetical protein
LEFDTFTGCHPTLPIHKPVEFVASMVKLGFVEQIVDYPHFAMSGASPDAFLMSVLEGSSQLPWNLGADVNCLDV